MTRYLLHDHAWYMWTAPAVLALIWIQAYFQFHVRVRDPHFLFYDDTKPALGPGKYFMPWEHQYVTMTPHTLIVGHDDLSPSGQTTTVRRGERSAWEQTTNYLPASRNKPIVLIWRANPKKLGELCALPHPALKHAESVLRDILTVDPNVDLEAYIDQMRLGVEVISLKRPGKKRDGGAVSLADGVDIPYEG